MDCSARCNLVVVVVCCGDVMVKPWVFFGAAMIIRRQQLNV